MTHPRSVSLISVAALLAALAMAALLATEVRAATELRRCGTVGTFVPATALLPGSITVDGTPIVIAPGTSIVGGVEPGTTQCVDFNIDDSGQITGGSVQPNITTNAQVCGVVTGITASDADSAGSITVDGQTFALAPGSSVPSAAQVGEDQCLTLAMNGLGQVTSGSALANIGSTARVCGTISGLAASDADSAGSLTIDGQTFTLAPGATLPASARVGEDQCMALTLNGFGQVSDATAQANVTSVATVCGQVNGAVASSPTADGSLTIDGVQRLVAPGTALSPELDDGTFVNVRQTLDAFGRIVGTEVLDAGASLADACGTSNGAAAPPDAGDPAVLHVVRDALMDLEGVLDAEITAPDDGAETAPAEDGVTPAPESGTAPAAQNADDGSLLPDTASLGRTIRVVATTGIPLLLLLVGLIGLTLRARMARVTAR